MKQPPFYGYLFLICLSARYLEITLLQTLVKHDYSAPDRGAWSIVMSMSVYVYVCLSVCLSVRNHIFGTTRPIFTIFFVHVTHGCGSVLL